MNFHSPPLLTLALHMARRAGPSAKSIQMFFSFLKLCVDKTQKDIGTDLVDFNFILPFYSSDFRFYFLFLFLLFILALTNG